MVMLFSVLYWEVIWGSTLLPTHLASGAWLSWLNHSSQLRLSMIKISDYLALSKTQPHAALNKGEMEVVADNAEKERVALDFFSPPLNQGWTLE